MYPGETRLVQCDGGSLLSVVLKSFYKTFTSSGTFTKPPGYTAFQGILWSGGGGGNFTTGGTTGYDSAGGGGGARSTVIQLGGTSVLCGNGGAGSDTTKGEDGIVPAGGGGCGFGVPGGNGVRGELRIWGII